jgi:hypothetical protein
MKINRDGIRCGACDMNDTMWVETVTITAVFLGIVMILVMSVLVLERMDG